MTVLRNSLAAVYKLLSGQNWDDIVATAMVLEGNWLTRPIKE